MKTLGIMLNNKGTALDSHFAGTIPQLRALATKWGRFNLSLPGRVAISKTMMISQIGYGACIITPSDNQISVMQGIIDGFVTNGLVIAKDRLYAEPRFGGLGLIEIKPYCIALQCSWIKRCYTELNDVWRWTLARLSSFEMDMTRPSGVDKNLYPILYNIVQSFGKLQESFWKKHENFLLAPLVDNHFFLRAAPERRAPVRGCVDKNLLGVGFYTQNKEALLNLRMECLIRGNKVVTIQQLCANTGLNICQNVYMYLSTAAKFAIKKYGKKTTSNGTSVKLGGYLVRIRKGSGKLRKILTATVAYNGWNRLEELRVVKTFFELVACEKPDGLHLSSLYGLWNKNFLTNRERTFAFQFFNNSVSVGARTAARYRNVGNNVDQRCTFCVKAGRPNPGREDFNHLFISCPVLVPVLNRYLTKFYDVDYDPNNADTRLFKMTGLNQNLSPLKQYFAIIHMFALNYVTWQYKLKKFVPSLATLELDVGTVFNDTLSCNKKLEEMALNCDSFVCRRWREQHQGRG
jgi:hypothetical protein